MSKLSKTNKPSAKVKGSTIKAMYKTKEITNRTNKNLWVVFEKNNPKKGLVFSMVHNRDTVRNAGSKIFGTSITNVRSRRVSNYRKAILNK